MLHPVMSQFVLLTNDSNDIDMKRNIKYGRAKDRIENFDFIFRNEFASVILNFIYGFRWNSFLFIMWTYCGAF